MSGMKDLLGDTPYPYSPGYKEPTTSLDAARAITSKAAILRDRIMATLCSVEHGLTPDETAARLGEDILAVRPRFSELKEAGAIVKTGERRRNGSGLMAAVWKVSP